LNNSERIRNFYFPDIIHFALCLQAFLCSNLFSPF
jgi:hypothetical protein